ncbi:MAG: sodium ABC transporter ATP-binding protein, partial [Clostridia bacterium]
MENILEIKKLSKTYSGFSLKGIDLNIPKGSIVGLIGE